MQALRRFALGRPAVVVGEAVKKELVEIAAALEHETDAAYLINDGTEKVWVPKSQVEYDEGAGRLLLDSVRRCSRCRPGWPRSADSSDFREECK